MSFSLPSSPVSSPLVVAKRTRPHSTAIAPNSTAHKAVFREDGTRVYGLDAELEIKAQAKRDPAHESQLLNWIEQVTESTASNPEDIGESLKSGVLLCKLVNVIEPGSVKKVETRELGLCYVENINNYLKACWKLGIPSTDLFVASDLYQKRGIPQVIQNVTSLARLAQADPKWTGPKFETSAKSSRHSLQANKSPTPRRASKKWEPVNTNYKGISVQDIELEPPELQEDPKQEEEVPMVSVQMLRSQLEPSKEDQEIAALKKAVQEERDLARTKLEAELKKKQEELDAQLQLAAQKEGELNKLQDELKQQKEAFLKEKKILEDQRHEKDQLLKQKIHHLEKKEEELSNREREWAKQRMEEKKLQKQREEEAMEKEKRTKTLQEQLEQLSSERQLLVEREAKHTEDQNLFHQREEALLKEVEQIKRENKELKEELQAQKNVTQTLQKESLPRENTLTQLTSVVQEHILLNNKLTKQLEGKEQEIDALKQQIEQLKQTETELQQQFKEISQSSTELKSYVQANAKENYELQKQLQIETQVNIELKQRLQEMEDKYRKVGRERMEKQMEQQWGTIYKANENFATLKTFKRKGLKRKPSRKSVVDFFSDDEEALDPLDENYGDVLDLSLILMMQECLKNIFFPDGDENNHVTAEDCHPIGDALRHELGRRHFAKILSQSIKQIPSYVIAYSCFDALVYLMETCLNQMDTTSPDFIVLKKLMKCSCTLLRKVEGKTQYLKDFIKDHECWKDLNFWREYFLDELYGKHKEYNSEGNFVDADFISTLSCSFVLHMLHWGLDSTFVEKFVTTTVNAGNLPVEDAENLQASIIRFMHKNENVPVKVEEAQEPEPSLLTSRTTLRNAAKMTSKLNDEFRKNFSVLKEWKSKVIKTDLSIPMGPVIKQGALSKKARNRNNWGKRWFVLKADCLYYLKDPKDKKAQKILDLTHCKVKAATPADGIRRPFCVVISFEAPLQPSGSSSNYREALSSPQDYHKRDYFVCAPNEKQQKEWIEEIQKCIDTTQ